MCGIFGITLNNQSTIDINLRWKIVKDLFLLSESRGKEASGFSIVDKDEILVYKTPFPASTLIKSKPVENAFFSVLNKNSNAHFTSIGHSRLVTNGYEHLNKNNQPVIKSGLVGIHNGIVVNVNQLWGKYTDEQKLSDLDSEIILTLLRRFYVHDTSLKEAVEKVYREIYGMTSIAVLFEELSNLLLATNNGSLYYVHSKDGNSFIFASEYYIVSTLINKNRLNNVFDITLIRQLKPDTACLVDLNNTHISLDRLDGTDGDKTFDNLNILKGRLSIREIDAEITTGEIYQNKSLEHGSFHVPESYRKEFDRREEVIASLRRCSRCLLPDSFPFIVFNEKGVCNYCNNYSKLTFEGEQAFVDYISPYKRNDGRPDCLLPFSGGRDSSFVLHYIKKELGMTPLAYSYDWGMITDLARRNQARMCGKLGVEHILISADIRKKRANIRKNVLAWLKRPNLGTIPLFMAGDKQYFYYANLLMKQNNIKLSVMGENMLETTKFKSGFCGISPSHGKHHTYSLSLTNKLKMLLFYGREYLLNPAYLNSSLLDTFDAFKSYYVIKHNNINLYNYLRWDEKKIENLLINEYDWEIDPGTKTTWRIGDGTAAFYNYIYYMVAGFTENDTFRSNQIREGMLTREEALTLVNEENKPRFESIKWYCDTINIDFNDTVQCINAIPKLYAA